MQKGKILIIEDNSYYVDFLRREFFKQYHLLFANTLRLGLRHLKEVPDIVILDLKIPEADGKEPKDLGKMAIKSIKEFNQDIEIIVLTGTTDKIRDAVDCMKLGAYDFFLKDEEGLKERLKMSIRNALERKQLRSQNLELISKEKRFAEQQKLRYQADGNQKHPDITYHFDTLVGESTAAKAIYSEIEKVTQRSSEATVLITGETGTGKELVAAAIHFNTANRSQKQMVITNITSLSNNLLESELFGIEKKTATGVDPRIGYFEQANGSTLFLDEIAEIPKEIQAKLLRVLEDKKFQRIGSSEMIPSNVRIIAATNKSLSQEVAAENFREDLYYRLSQLIIHLPSLSERREDIPDLIEHFLFRFKVLNRGNENVFVTETAKAFLTSLDWPGNIRQLKHVVERAIVYREAAEIDVEIFREAYHAENRQFQRNPKPAGLPAIAPQAASPTAAELPSWDHHRTEHEKFIDIEDPSLQLKIFMREFIETEGNIKSVKETLKIHANTANRLLKLTMEYLFIELCNHNCDITRMAKDWHLDAVKLENALTKANRLRRFLDNSLRQYKNISILAEVMEVNEDHVQKALDLFNK